MNFQKIIKDATTPEEQLQEQQARTAQLNADKEFVDGFSKQSHNEWLQYPSTQALIKHLHIKMNECAQSSVNESTMQNPNIHTIHKYNISSASFAEVIKLISQPIKP